MAIKYQAGERKVRPSVYQRQTNAGLVVEPALKDGICAIPVQAAWGPLGKVVKNTRKAQLVETYGAGTYGTGYTIPAAEAMFDGGAAVVYTYRLGTGGKQAAKTISDGLTVTAKYPGTLAISVSVQTKLGDATKKLFNVYVGTALKETFVFAADGKAEGANLIAAVDSAYITITAETAPAVVAVLDVASGALTGGENPTVTNDDYNTAFNALEPYFYNTIALDVEDDENLTLSLLLQAYLKNASDLGKTGIAVVGEKTSVDFATRCKHAAGFNDCMTVYCGTAWETANGTVEGVKAICQTAGVIAATPSSKSIVHTAVAGATDLVEYLTNDQYVEAINNGMLVVSMAPDGTIWYDSGITTLVNPEADTQDNGWKKIKRTKIRFEMFDRLDRALQPKVGKVDATTDGSADIVQTGQRVLTEMVAEKKLYEGATFAEDAEMPMDSDSAWYTIEADDIDTLEKIYEHYKFRYSQN